MLLKVSLLMVCLLGLAMSGFGIYFIGLGSAARSWPAADGRVVATRIRTDVSTTGDLNDAQREASRRYYPEIQYAWTVDGARYTGSRYRLGTTHAKYKTRAEAQEAAARFREGSAIAVYYDPRQPDEAVLDRAASAGVVVPLALGSLILAMGVLGLRFIGPLRAALDR